MESEAIADYIEKQLARSDSRKRKVILQARAVKHEKALSNNNNQKEVKHGKYNNL